MKRIDFKNIILKKEYVPIIKRYEGSILMDNNLSNEVKDNLGICISIACYYAVYDNNLFDELLSLSITTLVKYSEKYDKSKNITFSSFITKYIQGVCITHVDRTTRTIVRKSRNEWENVDVISLDELIHFQNQYSSNRDIYKIDMISDNSFLEKEDENEIKEEQKLLIKKCLNLLKSKKQKMAIEKYYLSGKTYVEISEEMCTTRQAVEDLVKNGIKMIKLKLKKEE